MKRLWFTWSLFVFCFGLSAQETLPPDTVSGWFKEFSIESAKHEDLWGRSLYGPVLLVDASTRTIYANVPDTAAALKPYGDIYIGRYPDELIIANTAIRWNGVDWAMVMLPLPESKYDRASLLAHESFHVAQPALGLPQYNDTCIHLDEKEGRIYLRLELEALKQALGTEDEEEMKKHLSNAFLFRSFRRSLYPGSELMENRLELNEGVAEYTGEKLSGRPEDQKKAHFNSMIDRFYENPSFVRSFAYQAIPVYGYLLDKTRNGWCREITSETDLTAFLAEAFDLRELPVSKERVEREVLNYNSAVIVAEEEARDREVRELLALYERKFVRNNRLEILFEKMSVSYDPRNIRSLNHHGTVYPTLYVKDNWGVLQVSEGALMSPDWRKVTVSEPLDRQGNIVTGEGWILKLAEGYTIFTDNETGVSMLRKQ